MTADHLNGHEPEIRPLVMVVDDDPVIGCVLAGALNRAGFDVEIFQDAVKALDSVHCRAPDVAVVDWVMPGVDGLDVIDRLREMSPGLAAVLVTNGQGGQEAVELARRSGRVDTVLGKPFDLADFLDTVSRCVNNKASGTRAERLEPAAAGGALAGWLALEGREAYFEHILDSLIDAVMMLDRQGRVIYCNNGSRRMFGLWGQAADGLSLRDFCPPDNLLADLFAHFFGKHPPVQEQSEGYFVKADGTRFYTIFSASLFRAGSHGSAVLLVVKDINASHMLFEQTTAQTRQLERQALTDPLTGIYNRRYFDQRLEEEFRRTERYRSFLTLVMIDFDHFKKVNDRFGHLVGDQVLRQGAEVFGRTLRDVDTLSRWGGEEYMVLLPETNGETGQAVARRLHLLIGDQEQWEQLAPGLRVTVSMGIVSLPWAKGRLVTINDVLENLDRALYRAKRTGRNRIVRYLDDRDGFIEV